MSDEQDAYSVENFCERHDFSRATLYKLWEQNLGPEKMRVGKRVLISREAARKWRERMERESAEPVTA